MTTATETPLSTIRPIAIRTIGAALLLGTLAWALGQQAMTETDVVSPWEMATGSFFMLGAWGLHRAVLATRATGPRKGRIIPIVFMVTAPISVVVNLASLFYRSYDDLPLWVMIIDPAWPITMVGMAVEGIAIARTAKWTGPLRWLPLAAGCWLPAMIAFKFVLAWQAQTVASGLWLLATYGLIGTLLLTRPRSAIGW